MGPSNFFLLLQAANQIENVFFVSSIFTKKDSQKRAVCMLRNVVSFFFFFLPQTQNIC